MLGVRYHRQSGVCHGCYTGAALGNKANGVIDKNRKTGRVDGIWPGSGLHFRDAIEDPRWEDMEIKYHSVRNLYLDLLHSYDIV